MEEFSVVRDGRLNQHGRRRLLRRIEKELPARPALRDMERMIAVESQAMRNIVAKLAILSEETGMPITQENGQRTFGPPRDSAEVPPRGSEVFVGKIPRHICETDLMPVFSRVGKIYKIRLMMDFSGTNRGYCFVQYTTREAAERAICMLDGYEIIKGRSIGVLKSVDNCRLIVGGIPKDKSEEEILRELQHHTDGVRRVVAYPSAEDKTKNRGFAFVEYDSHKSAAMARRKLIPGNIRLWGHDVCVDWAEPEPAINELYVRNLNPHTGDSLLRQAFNKVSSNGVVKVRRMRGFQAFIQFASCEQADAARLALNKAVIDGAEIEVFWAKRKDDHKWQNDSGRCQHRHRGTSHSSNNSPPPLNSSNSSPIPMNYHQPLPWSPFLYENGNFPPPFPPNFPHAFQMGPLPQPQARSCVNMMNGIPEFRRSPIGFSAWKDLAPGSVESAFAH